MEQEYENYQEEEEGSKSAGVDWAKLALFAIVAVLLIAFAALFIFMKTSSGAGKAPAGKNQPAGGESAAPENQSEGDLAAPARDYNYQAPSRESCQSLSSEEEIQLCLDNVVAARAIQDKNLSACYEINDEFLRSACVSKVARDVKSVDLCFEISDDLARYRCVASIATDQNDSALCGNLQEEFRQDCQDRVAAFSIAQDGDKDSLYKCRKLKSQEYIDLCFLYSFINKFGGDCGAVPQNYRQECLDVLAKE